MKRVFNSLRCEDAIKAFFHRKVNEFGDERKRSSNSHANCARRANECELYDLTVSVL